MITTVPYKKREVYYMNYLKLHVHCDQALHQIPPHHISYLNNPPNTTPYYQNNPIPPDPIPSNPASSPPSHSSAHLGFIRTNVKFVH